MMVSLVMLAVLLLLAWWCWTRRDRSWLHYVPRVFTQPHILPPGFDDQTLHESPVKAASASSIHSAPEPFSGQTCNNELSDGPQASPDTHETEAIPDSADDLTRIKGIGPVIEKQLHSMGIVSFAQIAALDTSDKARVADALGRFRGRIERDNWVGQARSLTSNVGG